jgi:hypothetical protein
MMIISHCSTESNYFEFFPKRIELNPYSRIPDHIQVLDNMGCQIHDFSQKRRHKLLNIFLLSHLKFKDDRCFPNINWENESHTITSNVVPCSPLILHSTCLYVWGERSLYNAQKIYLPKIESAAIYPSGHISQKKVPLQSI